jgi:excisionase family DNA binding protein
MAEKRLTYRDLQERWQCGKRKIQTLVAAGQLRAIRLGACTVRFNPSEVERFERLNTDC